MNNGQANSDYQQGYADDASYDVGTDDADQWYEDDLDWYEEQFFGKKGGKGKRKGKGKG